MKKIYILFALCSTLALNGQVDTLDFESFDLQADSFINDANSEAFVDGIVSLPNSFTASNTGGFWNFWALSSKKDTVTAGFQNQYSTIAGEGFNGSQNFAVGYAFQPIVIRFDQTVNLQSTAITNSTYTTKSMENGDAFAKKFGGITGDDADSLIMEIAAYLDGELKPNSIRFPLADYRFEDNSQDYIVKAWEEVDLSSLGRVDSVSFALETSDIGAFGANTPLYFCLDQLIYSQSLTSKSQDLRELDIKVFPNPTSDYIQISTPQNTMSLKGGLLEVFSQDGRLVLSKESIGIEQEVWLGNLTPGKYFLVLRFDDQWAKTILLIN